MRSWPRSVLGAVPAGALAGVSAVPTREGLTAQGTILGTFQYMAPEQLEGKEADARTDLFAFGALVYETVTGKKAFEGKSQASLTKFKEANGHVSPDGRWIAYQSDESGRYEIYVRPFPDAQGGKWQISSDGGTDPRWRRDGTELFYFSGDDKLMAVAVRHDASGFTTAKTDALFQVTKTANRTNYAVTQDGQRFLVNAISDTANTASITVVLNWTTALKK